jgi:hypothetical protein
MKNIILVFWGILIGITGLAQHYCTLDSVIKSKEDLISINIIDSSYIYTYARPQLKGNSFILINRNIFDTLSRAVIRIPVIMNNSIYFNSDVHLEFESQKYTKFMYSLKDSSFNEYNSYFLHDNGYQQLYRFETLKLFLVDPMSDKVDLFADFTDYMMSADYVKKETDDLGKQYPLVSIADVFFFNENEAIVTFCKLGDFEGCYGYYYFYISNNRIIDVTNKFELKIELNSYNTQKPYFDFISTDNNYFRLSIISTERKKEIISRIFDITTSYIHTVLNLSETSIIGIRTQNGLVQNYFLYSKIDNNKQVIIPYKFIPELDIAMYKAYNNENLNKEDFKGFNKYEFGILRNLIFAKHNYDFSSEFYQAYFNLYAFYNAPDMRNSRTKDVNGKLTVTDRQNLELIKSLEN